MLHQEVYATEKFKNWAKKRVVLVQIDFPRRKKLPAELTKQNAALKQKYEVKGYPTVYFIDADEKRMGQRHGYIPGGVSAWIDAAEAQIR